MEVEVDTKITPDQFLVPHFSHQGLVGAVLGQNEQKSVFYLFVDTLRNFGRWNKHLIYLQINFWDITLFTGDSSGLLLGQNEQKWCI